MTVHSSLSYEQMNALKPPTVPVPVTSGPEVSSTLSRLMSDDKRVRRLNAPHIRAQLTSDGEWYQARLADDFVCIESDGRILDKGEFLHEMARGSDLLDFWLDEVDVRLYGGVALVGATGFSTAKKGMWGTSGYTLTRTFELKPNARSYQHRSLT